MPSENPSDKLGHMLLHVHIRGTAEVAGCHIKHAILVISVSAVAKPYQGVLTTGCQ